MHLFILIFQCKVRRFGLYLKVLSFLPFCFSLVPGNPTDAFDVLIIHCLEYFCRPLAPGSAQAVKEQRSVFRESRVGDPGEGYIDSAGDMAGCKLICFPDIEQNCSGGSMVLLQPFIDITEKHLISPYIISLSRHSSTHDHRDKS